MRDRDEVDPMFALRFADASRSIEARHSARHGRPLAPRIEFAQPYN